MARDAKSLAELVRERRGTETVTSLAKRSGLSKSEISAIEKGRVGLPGAGKRRDLAKAIGVSHLDILLAAGEITSDEIQQAGVSGLVERDPNDPRERLLASIEGRPLTAQAVDIAIAVLDAHARTTSSNS